MTKIPGQKKDWKMRNWKMQDQKMRDWKKQDKKCRAGN